MTGVECGLGGEFINLGFDDGGEPTGEETFQPAATLLPGWTVYIGTLVSETVVFNNFLSEKAMVGVYSVEYAPELYQGKYGLGIASGAEILSGGPQVAAAIGQSGEVPTWAKSLTFRGVIADPREMVITIDGIAYPYIRIGGGPTDSVYSFDVSPFAGSEVELRISARPGDFGGGGLIDSLSFSPLPAVPEPSTWALLGLGLTALMWGRRKL